MGGTDYPKPPSLVTTAAMQAMIARGATSPGVQHSTIRDGALQVTDPNGASRVASGSYTFSRGPNLGKTIFAHITFDANGNPLVIIGQQPDGTHGLAVYNQLGAKVVFLGAEGVTQYDLAGHPRSVMGALTNGDYGSAVYSRANDGTYQEVLPASPAVTDATVATSVTSYTSGGGPSQTVTVGASGKADVTVGAFIGLSLVNGTSVATSPAGFVGLYVDGSPAPGTPGDFIGMAFGDSTLNTSASIAASCSNTRTVSGLSPGSHLFELYYRTAGTSTNFSARTLTVQPI